MSSKVRQRRPIAIITGAAGGMGRVCASRLADRYALVLSEYRADALDQLAGQLAGEGADIVATISGDLGQPESIEAIVAACGDRPAALVHTAGLSPAMARWQDIIATNLIATARLLHALDPLVGPGMASVLIASTARLVVPPAPEALLAVLEQPLASSFISDIGPLLGDDEAQLCNLAYCWSKWWVAREAGRRAQQWGPRGARIMSISPGMIYTPMARLETDDPQLMALVENTPVGRWGMPADIANTVDFILSDKAGFLTGSDILVDGGVGVFMQQHMAR
ncbi:MAG TPA: SDR family oxidoreductase [Novosphingobium sp.]|nr:SDR family oxidoreductase [Novosphingobium sp.]